MTTARYIAFEGLEGCGKSTHVTRLAAALGAIATREPGGTTIGASLRATMIDAANTMLSPRAEALLMAADRAQHLDELVTPALQRGQHVVSDRSAYSSLAYQGYGRQLDLAMLKQFNSWAIGNRWPDLVVYIDVPLDILLERLKKRELDRFEREDRSFFERIAHGFNEMAKAEPDRWLIVDGTPPKDELAATILREVASRLNIATQ
ncbi:MAG: thymidylate kinase [Actinomycetota bacterium]